MKYVSIDIETSGLDPENNQVLSIGAIIEDTTTKLPLEDCPKFHAIVLQRQITGSPRAITMNAKIIDLMSEYLEADKEKKEELEQIIDFYETDEIAKAFFDFLWSNGLGGYTLPLDKEVRIINGKPFPMFGSRIKPILMNVAGKNFGTFDNVFLKKLPWWQKILITKQRILDPALLYCDWVNDEALPSLTECKSRAGIKGAVTHDALEDAWDVIQVMRHHY